MYNNLRRTSARMRSVSRTPYRRRQELSGSISGYKETLGDHGGVCIAPPTLAETTTNVVDASDTSNGVVLEVTGSTFSQAGPEPEAEGERLFAICRNGEYYLHRVDESTVEDRNTNIHEATTKIFNTVQQVRDSVNSSEANVASALGYKATARNRSKSNTITRGEGHQAASTGDRTAEGPPDQAVLDALVANAAERMDAAPEMSSAPVPDEAPTKTDCMSTIFSDVNF